MDAWILLLLLSIFLCFALKILLSNLHKNNKRRLPPGPSSIAIIRTIFWLKKSLFDIEPILRSLHAKYGPILTLRITSTPAIFIADRALAHHALVHNGASFADRPPAIASGRILSSKPHNISSAPYGPLWRLLRRNLTSEILHPSRTKLFTSAREWVLQILLGKLKTQAESGDRVVVVKESFQFAMFCLLVLMCFGEKLDEKEIKEIEDLQKSLHLSFVNSKVFAFLPKITKLVFRKRLNTLLEIRRMQKEHFIPLIRGRRRDGGGGGFVCSYVDSLLDLRIPEEGGRGLSEDEIVSLCSEFMTAGTETTATSLEWIMAVLVKHQEIQKKLLEEIEGVVAEEEEEKIKEEDLQKMPHLKAVIMEGLRRHPPAHFVLPHAVTEEIAIEGYVIPKNATVNFMVAMMGLDEKVWEEPMEFRPERFMGGGSGEEVDITGSREIKMMPFGVGRRICPGIELAMLHLKYFVANLVREFEWKTVEGEEVDLSEKSEVTVVMKNHLRARIVPRRNRYTTFNGY